MFYFFISLYFLFQKKKISKFIIIQKIIEHFIVNLRTKETKIGEYYSI